MGESEPGPTLNYHTPEAPSPKRPFWLVYFAACVAGFFLTDWAIAWIYGKPNRDGGVWFLEALGIVLTTLPLAIFKSAFPRAPAFTPRLAFVLGLLAPSVGLLIYSVFPWG